MTMRQSNKENSDIIKQKKKEINWFIFFKWNNQQKAKKDQLLPSKRIQWKEFLRSKLKLIQQIHLPFFRVILIVDILWDVHKYYFKWEFTKIFTNWKMIFWA